MSPQDEPCGVCGLPVPINDGETVFRLELPPISWEVIREEFRRAQRAPRPTGQRLRAAQVGANMYLGHDPGPFEHDEEAQVVLGESLLNLGAQVVAFHPWCARPDEGEQ